MRGAGCEEYRNQAEEYKFLQSIDDSSSYDTPAVRGRFIGRRTVERLARGDTVSGLDTVQRHSGVSFCRARITDEWNALDILNKSDAMCTVPTTLLRRGTKDLSVYIRANAEGTRAVIDTAIAAGVGGLVYTSSASIVFIGTDVVNVDKSGDSQVISDNNNLFDYTYVGSIASAHRLIGNELVPPPSYSPTTSSEPRLDPEGATAKLNESLHRVLPPICATTEYHHSTRTLGPYGTPPPNAGSILSAHNTPFDPHEPTGFVVRSRADEQVSFVTSGEQIYILEATELFDECERWLSSPKIQDTYTRLRKVVGVRVVVSRVVVGQRSFEATEESRWRRGIGDSCAELNSSGFHFDLREFCLHPRYSREDGRPRRTAIEIQESTTDFEQSTYGHTEGQER
ncbi:hypothetical protein BKA82DRAFT_4345905 [Pisolithus tinctorius]|nr:hypothetical protein BKA82DRAFT_4345905 [Pisolithus tinctorius]